MVVQLKRKAIVRRFCEERSGGAHRRHHTVSTQLSCVCLCVCGDLCVLCVHVLYTFTGSYSLEAAIQRKPSIQRDNAFVRSKSHTPTPVHTRHVRVRNSETASLLSPPALPAPLRQRTAKAHGDDHQHEHQQLLIEQLHRRRWTASRVPLHLPLRPHLRQPLLLPPPALRAVV